MPRPSQLQIVEGDEQAGYEGEVLPDSLVVRVLDEAGEPLPGWLVDFVVTSGGGAVSEETSTSDDEGFAARLWTLGTDTTQQQTLEARASDEETGEVLAVGVFTALARSRPRIDSVAVAAKTDTSVTLSWSASGSTAAEYRVERVSDDTTLVATLPADTTGFTDTGLVPGSSYQYRLGACAPDGKCIYSPLVTAVTSAAKADAGPTGGSGEAPAEEEDGGTGEAGTEGAPSDTLSIKALSPSVIELSWWGFAQEGEQYTVQRVVDGKLTGIAYLPIDSTRYLDRDLTAETLYEYRVRACDEAGVCSNTRRMSATTLEAPAESAPPPSEEEDPTPPPSYSGEVPAFPGAEGWGAGAVGGRGGKVHLVTTLADSGEGSLRACVDASGPRTCVFRVAGYIDLRSPLTITNPYLTIAGQTAPAGGITLRKHPSLETSSFNMLLFPRGRDGGKAHDVIIRYIRVRSGACPTCGDKSGVGSATLRSGISIVWGHDIILDHLSANWNTEDQIGISVPEYADADVHHFTLQRSLVGEPFGNHGTGVNIQSRYENPNSKKHFSIHHNLLSTINYRAPNVNMLGSGVINNVIYNSRVSAETRRHTTADFVNNYIKKGPVPVFMLHRHIHEASKYVDTPESSSIYWEGNVVDGSAAGWDILQFKEGEGIGYESYPNLPSSWRRTSRLPSAPFPVRTQSANAAYGSVLEDVGAIARVDCRGNWVDNRDAVEARMLREVATGTGGAVRDHQSQYGGYPSVNAGPACTDGDSDGMPDEFESLHDLNPDDSADAVLDRNRDGYSNLEAYLNGMAA